MLVISIGFADFPFVGESDFGEKIMNRTEGKLLVTSMFLLLH